MLGGRGGRPPATLSMAKAAELFRALGDTWRDSAKSAHWVELFVGGNRSSRGLEVASGLLLTRARGTEMAPCAQGSWT